MTTDSQPRRPLLALLYGLACHGIFGLAGLAMVAGLWSGMTLGFGTLSGGWAVLVNAVLLVQFPLVHSLLLTRPGRQVLARLAPGEAGPVLATTTYALIASIQLLLLFLLWTPSGIVWWQAEGAALWLIAVLYAMSWGLLAKASFDAGPELQSGFLGWWALLRGRRPVFPDMPEAGLFRVVRQPIYVAFALTLWTVPVWTPDQLAVATLYTAYCVLAPKLKERRFRAIYGARFAAYQAQVPYWLPRLLRRSGEREA
ncbi:MAG: isoprenylcysteine carboxylmethyltransferase family protein [Pseudomonadota bacterium]